MSDTRNFIDFDEIDEHGPQSYHRTYDITPAEIDRVELVGLGPVSVDAEAQKGDRPGEYDVEGTVRFTADYQCARCLEPYPIANESKIQLRYRPRPEATGEEEEVEISPDELDIDFYSERSIPLKQLAADQIQLSIPMKPLCDENCLGLCPNCGANRNREACTCEPSATDERWGALQDIREQLAKKKNV